MRIQLGILGALAMLVTAPTLSLGQTVNAEDLVKDLSRKTPITRSITVTPVLSPSEAATIKSVTGLSRSISVEERHALAPILRNDELPQVDMTIEFEFDSAQITPEAKDNLGQLGIALSSDELADSVFVLAGHTDAKGGDEYNQALSERRADAVRAFLVGRFQINPSMLIAVGFGEEQLKDELDPDSAVNRRVSVVNVSD